MAPDTITINIDLDQAAVFAKFFLWTFGCLAVGALVGSKT